MSDKVIIIGAGVIGASSALALQADGLDVTLIDRETPCAGASFGNAGAIVNSSCVPTAMPGIVSDVIRMLGQSVTSKIRRGQAPPPLSIRVAYFHRILPWLIRFIWQSRASNATKNATNLHALTSHAVASWHRLLGKTSLNVLLLESAWLKVYELEKTFAATAQARLLMDQIGTKYEVLTGPEIHDLEPNLAPIFNYGIYQRDCLRITNPQRLVQGMVDLLLSRGGSYRQFAVDLIRPEKDRVSLTGPSGMLVADKVVIAAGAWSRSLAGQLGDSVPLDTERGYHLMLPASCAHLLSGPVVNGESSFVLSPMETGIRLSSQIEFAGLQAKPDYRRVRSLLPAAQRMLPEIDTQEESVWMGCRPSLPDSLPILGFSNNSDRVVYAFGHQHLGMTLGAVTGMLVADLVAGRDPQIAVDPYRPNRF